MKHTLDELMDIVYRYYPRGVGMVDGDLHVKVIENSEEHARLVAARKKAPTDERWPAMLGRIQAHFPDAPLVNFSLHLPSANHDGCYSFTIYLPGAPHDRAVSFQVSFLAPYYIIHRSCTTEIVKEPRRDFFGVDFRGVGFQVSGSPFDPELISNVDDERLKRVTIKEHYVTFDLLPDQRPYAEWVAREIEATFRAEPMPPEVGTLLVPDLATPKLPGKVRLYDCLFSDNHEWVKPSPSDEPARGVTVDASRLTAPFSAVLTVLAALYVILWTLMPRTQGGFYGFVRTDGILRKEEVLEALAEIRKLLHAPVTPRDMERLPVFEAFTRELEALVAAWDGEGPPPPAMVACAAKLLGNPDTSSQGS